jgi:hypothetical protein
MRPTTDPPVVTTVVFAHLGITVRTNVGLYNFRLPARMKRYADVICNGVPKKICDGEDGKLTTLRETTANFFANFAPSAGEMSCPDLGQELIHQMSITAEVNEASLAIEGLTIRRTVWLDGHTNDVPENGDRLEIIVPSAVSQKVPYTWSYMNYSCGEFRSSGSVKDTGIVVTADNHDRINTLYNEVLTPALFTLDHPGGLIGAPAENLFAFFFSEASDILKAELKPLFDQKVTLAKMGYFPQLTHLMPSDQLTEPAAA